MYHGYETVI